MGNFLLRIMDTLSGTTEKRILLLGLDAAGKTTILYKLNLGEVIHTIPTVGFNVETIKYKNITFTYWDVGGQQKIRRLWHHYFDGSDALIYVIDCNDPSRLDEAKEELYSVLSASELQDIPLLIYANKQDLPNSLTTAQIVDKLDLTSKMRNRPWHCQGTVAVSGEGLYDGLDWLSSILNKRK